MTADKMEFTNVLNAATCAPNHGLSNDAIMARLRQWNQRYGVIVENADRSSLDLTFGNLSGFSDSLAREIYQLCPDVVSQGFGCYEELISEAKEAGAELNPEVLSLADGINFDDPEHGVKILARSLERDGKVHLWWD